MVPGLGGVKIARPTSGSDSGTGRFHGISASTRARGQYPASSSALVPASWIQCRNPSGGHRPAASSPRNATRTWTGNAVHAPSRRRKCTDWIVPSATASGPPSRQPAVSPASRSTIANQYHQPAERLDAPIIGTLPSMMNFAMTLPPQSE